MSKLYSDAAAVVRDVREHRKGLSGSKFANAAVFALACETLRFAEVLQELIDKAGVQLSDRNLALVLTYELLMGKGDIGGGGKAKAAVLACKTRLNSELARLKIRRKVSANRECGLSRALTVGSPLLRGAKGGYE